MMKPVPFTVILQYNWNYEITKCIPLPYRWIGAMREAVVLTWDLSKGQPGLKLFSLPAPTVTWRLAINTSLRKKIIPSFFHSTHLNYGWDMERTNCEQVSMKSEVVKKEMRSSLWRVWCVKPRGIVVKRVTFFPAWMRLLRR